MHRRMDEGLNPGVELAMYHIHTRNLRARAHTHTHSHACPSIVRPLSVSYPSILVNLRPGEGGEL